MYVSIDIETLGLNHDYCDVIEFGAVIDDLKTPLNQLPTFHTYVLPPKRYAGGKYHHFYQGEPFAMAMHAEKLKRIADRAKDWGYANPDEVGPMFADWLVQHGHEGDGQKKMEVRHTLDQYEPVKISVGGKNFSRFDFRFLEKLEDWDACIKIHHRTYDPSMLYLDPNTDNVPPSLSECLKRAGYTDKVVKHDAVEDARDVIRVLRHKWEYRHDERTPANKR
jgi:hypothetical protein